MFILHIQCVLLSLFVTVHCQSIRVLGGSPTTIQQFPVIAQLLLDPWGSGQYSQHCAGVIITSRHILSTAHCFQYNRETGNNYTYPDFWRVRVGSSFRSRGGVLHKVKAIVPHREFDKYYFTNDVAIVVLSKKILFGSTTRQATIANKGTELKPNSLCTLIGWGVTQVGGQQSDQLQLATIFTVDQSDCRFRYRTIGSIIADSMFCAGRIDVDGIDGCFGDSGGPLFYKGVVTGLVSFGYTCGNRYYPGVYTKISYYIDWIVNVIRRNK
ncbi:trypsin, alkaline C-like [Zerene cesonia]|uniref:trypsin, alkaline C-like n=1 Tax=Zerene cesonia TaxID=33412 RepID=UPI0018E5935D|nr:trypsin, alkaline C-like [Zerene cesonia]